MQHSIMYYLVSDYIVGSYTMYEFQPPPPPPHILYRTQPGVRTDKPPTTPR